MLRWKVNAWLSICCHVRKKNFWKLNRIIHVSSKFKMSKVMNINTGQMEALEHVKNNKLFLILLNKKAGVATKCSLLSQPSILGTGWRPEPSNSARASANCCGEHLYLDGSGLLGQASKWFLPEKCQHTYWGRCIHRYFWNTAAWHVPSRFWQVSGKSKCLDLTICQVSSGLGQYCLIQYFVY